MFNSQLVNNRKDFTITMTLKNTLSKSVVKKAVGSVVLISAMGLGFAMMSQTGYKAEPARAADENQSKIDAQNAKVKQTVTGIAITSDIFDKMNDAKKNGSVLDQATLDGYAYYLYQYATSNQTYTTTDNTVSTPESGFKLLTELYKQSNVEPAYTLTDEGDLTITRELKKPDNYDQVVKSVDEQANAAVDQVNDVTKNSKDTSTNIEVDVDTGLQK